MPNLQQWLNAWVKVNTSKNNAVALGSPNNFRTSDHGLAAPSTGSAAPSPNLHHNGPAMKQQRGDPDSSLRTTATSIMSHDLADPELQAIRKFSSRRHKRRLQRTNSFSDLIREKAKHRDHSSSTANNKQPSPQRQEAAPSTPSTEEEEELAEVALYWQHPPQSSGQQPPPQQQQQELSGSPADTVVHSNSKIPLSSPPVSLKETISTTAVKTQPPQDEEEEDDHSRSSSSSRFWGVAGLFASEAVPQQHQLSESDKQQQEPYHTAAMRPPFTSLPARSHHRHHHAAPPSPKSISSTYSTTSNNTNSLRLRHEQLAELHQRRSSGDDESSAANRSTTSRRVKQDSSSGGIVVGGVRLPFFTTAPSPEPEENNIFGGKSTCPGCQVAEKELQAVSDNLEYMRGVAIHKELACVKCQHREQAAVKANKNPTVTMKNASQQVLEVTGRHKNQIEQLLKQRTHWQRNIHFKLEKFANLCRNMNNESSLQNEKARTMEQELIGTRRERDEMAAELERMKTEAALFEQERKEHQRVKNALLEYESRGLDHAEEALAARDEIITKLSSRLESVLDTLQMERQQQRQRRQIIFPPRDPKEAPPVATSTAVADAVAAEAMSQHNFTHGHGHSIDHHHHSSSSSNNNNNNNNRINQHNDHMNGRPIDEISQLRAELLDTQRRLEAAQLLARQRELALQLQQQPPSENSTKVQPSFEEGRGS